MIAYTFATTMTFGPCSLRPLDIILENRRAAWSDAPEAAGVAATGAQEVTERLDQLGSVVGRVESGIHTCNAKTYSGRREADTFRSVRGNRCVLDIGRVTARDESIRRERVDICDQVYGF